MVSEGRAVHDAGMDLAEAMAELYEGAPEQFVAHRAALVSRLKQDGQVDLAQEVGAARRPSLAAWATNLLVRSDPEPARRLADLGRELREAQATMAGDRIRELTARRRDLVDELTAAASALAQERGHAMEGTTRQELAATLSAALVSDEACAAATSGVLTRSLSYSGFGDVDVTAATATPLSPEPAAAGADAAAAPDEGTEARERVRQGVADAEADLGQRRRDLDAARDHEEVVSAEVEQLQRQLGARRVELERARARVGEADAAVARAAALLEAARGAMDRA